MKHIKYLTKYIIIGLLIILLLFIIFYDFFKIKEGFGLKDISKIVGDIKNITNVVGDIPNEINNMRRSITNKEVVSTKNNNVAASAIFNVQSN